MLACGATICLALISHAAPAQRADEDPGTRSGLAVIAPLENDGPIGFYIVGSPAGDDREAADRELCRWALADWARHSAGRIELVEAPLKDALIRIRLVEPGAGLFGEMRPVRVGDRRGAEVFVQTMTDSLAPEVARAARQDPLFRDSVVYLTCLHETGHALGLEHTADFAAIMYYFGFGGDIGEFFGRYRARLGSRADIERVSGLSASDIARLHALYSPAGESAVSASSSR